MDHLGSNNLCLCYKKNVSFILEGFYHTNYIMWIKRGRVHVNCELLLTTSMGKVSSDRLL